MMPTQQSDSARLITPTMLVLFLVLQRHYMQGLLLGSVKG